MENFSKQRREMGRGGETEWEEDRERDFILKTELEVKLILDHCLSPTSRLLLKPTSTVTPAATSILAFTPSETNHRSWKAVC